MAVFLCALILCGCGANNFKIDDITNFSSSLIASTPSILPSASDKPVNISTQIYAAKSTATYNKEMLFPKSSFNSIDEDSYFYYSSLPSKLKKLYKTLCTSIEYMADGFIDLGKITDDEISLLVTSIKNDKPEYFWLGRDYIINTKNNGYKEIAFKFKSKDYSINYLFTPEKRNDIISKLKSLMMNLEEKLQSKSDYERELYIHDFVVRNCDYDDEALTNQNNHQNAYNIYGTLIQKKSVCEGYAKAIQLLNNHFGIKTTVVTGKSNNQNHMWNLVNIYGSYYHLDATFNDGANSNLYSYFNLTDTAIKRSHQIDNSFYKSINLPKADSLEKSYFAVNNSIIKDDPYNDIKNAIEHAISNNKTFIDIGYADNASKIYKNSDEMQSDNIDISKIINFACKAHKVKVNNIRLLFATNGNFKIMWEYE